MTWRVWTRPVPHMVGFGQKSWIYWAPNPDNGQILGAMLLNGAPRLTGSASMYRLVTMRTVPTRLPIMAHDQLGVVERVGRRHRQDHLANRRSDKWGNRYGICEHGTAWSIPARIRASCIPWRQERQDSVRFQQRRLSDRRAIPRGRHGLLGIRTPRHSLGIGNSKMFALSLQNE